MHKANTLMTRSSCTPANPTDSGTELAPKHEPRMFRMLVVVFVIVAVVKISYAEAVVLLKLSFGIAIAAFW